MKTFSSRYSEHLNRASKMFIIPRFFKAVVNDISRPIWISISNRFWCTVPIVIEKHFKTFIQLESIYLYYANHTLFYKSLGTYYECKKRHYFEILRCDFHSLSHSIKWGNLILCKVSENHKKILLIWISVSEISPRECNRKLECMARNFLWNEINTFNKEINIAIRKEL